MTGELMQEPAISRDTQAVLLLCGRFAPREAVDPLDLREYNRVVDLLEKRSERPANLLDADARDLDWPAAGLDSSRIAALLDRRMALGLATERWTQGGLWVISRNDEVYPPRLHAHLGRSAPPLLWGVGDAGIASSGGVAIVGSRNLDEGGGQWCAEIAAECARQRLTVVSGGARGADQIGMAAALDAGGRVTAVLPEGLGKPSVASRYREAVMDGRLLLLSPFYPDAGFTIGNAMGRNKVLYGLAEAAVIVRADARSGGTWAGAEEELKRETRIPLFVRVDPDAEGNRALIALGAREFPVPPWSDLRRALTGAGEETLAPDAETKPVQTSLFDGRGR
jgi:predicted Rossmann fold nucleotide-binding protein DprA/Smf involved in DNA uptake